MSPLLESPTRTRLTPILLPAPTVNHCYIIAVRDSKSLLPLPSKMPQSIFISPISQKGFEFILQVPEQLQVLLKNQTIRFCLEVSRVQDPPV